MPSPICGFGRDLLSSHQPFPEMSLTSYSSCDWELAFLRGGWIETAKSPRSAFFSKSFIWRVVKNSRPLMLMGLPIHPRWIQRHTVLEWTPTFRRNCRTLINSDEAWNTLRFLLPKQFCLIFFETKKLLTTLHQYVMMLWDVSFLSQLKCATMGFTCF